MAGSKIVLKHDFIKLKSTLKKKNKDFIQVLYKKSDIEIPLVENYYFHWLYIELHNMKLTGL